MTLGLYISASEVRRGDLYVRRYADMLVFETYETRRGTVAICVEGPRGPHEFRHRPATKVLVIRRKA